MATPNGFESIETVTRVGNTLKMDRMTSNNKSVFLEHQRKLENTKSQDPLIEENIVDKVLDREETIVVKVEEVLDAADPKM